MSNCVLVQSNDGKTTLLVSWAHTFFFFFFSFLAGHTKLTPKCEEWAVSQGQSAHVCSLFIPAWAQHITSPQDIITPSEEERGRAAHTSPGEAVFLFACTSIFACAQRRHMSSWRVWDADAGGGGSRGGLRFFSDRRREFVGNDIHPGATYPRPSDSHSGFFSFIRVSSFFH